MANAQINRRSATCSFDNNNNNNNNNN